MVLSRSLFQGTFVILGMIIFRVDDSSTYDTSPNNNHDKADDDVEPGQDSNNLDGEGVGMVLIHDELLNDEKKLDDETASLLAKSREVTYNTLSTSKEPEFKSSPNDTSLPPRIIQRPFGTTPTMRNIVILRGLIGGFGFINYYYALSTLPLGDATTLLSLYPIITVFLAHFILGEEIKPLHLVAAVFSVIGATLISRPSFIFGSEDDGNAQQHDPPPALGYVSAIVGSCCGSAVIVLIRKAGRAGAHTLQLLFSWLVFGISYGLLAGFIGSSNSESQQWRVPSREELPYILGVCVAGTVGHFLLNYSAKLMPATLAGLIRSSNIFYAYLLEIVVLGEHPEKGTYLGVLFVLSSLVLVLLAPNEKTGNMMKHFGSIGNLVAAK